MLDILRLQTITGLTGKIQLPKAEAAKNKKLLAKEQQKSLKLAKKCKSLEKKLFLLQAAEPEKES